MAPEFRRAIVLLLTFGVGAGAGLLIGSQITERDAYHRTFEAQKRLIEPVIAASADYEAVTIAEESQGDAHLEGKVQSAEARERLRREMEKLFGVAKAERMVADVSVGKE
jgi:hypothetical protein